VDAKSDKGAAAKSVAGLKVAARGDREIVMTREFNAPRRLVFDALTKPELVKKWLLGPEGWSMPVCEIDLRVGGKYRYVWRRDSTGKEMGVGGEYREIVKNKRIVCTELFDDAWYAGEALLTTTLVESGGKTTMTTAILYESKEARDGVLKSDMESGVGASYDRLEELVAQY
jgi:uncharacterized protein YndB with AHSA1/START domain